MTSVTLRARLAVDSPRLMLARVTGLGRVLTLDTASLAFAIGVGTLIVSAAVSYRYRKDVATLSTGLVTAIVSGWTIVASLVFSLPTVQNLALASGLALAALAITGMTEHELETERAVEYSASRDEHEPHLSAAA